MLDDQVRFGLPKLRHAVVPGQHGTGMNAAMLGCFDIVLHIAHENRFAGFELILAENILHMDRPDRIIRSIELFN